jgi:hypothetical protein
MTHMARELAWGLFPIVGVCVRVCVCVCVCEREREMRVNGYNVFDVSHVTTRTLYRDLY